MTEIKAPGKKNTQYKKENAQLQQQLDLMAHENASLRQQVPPKVDEPIYVNQLFNTMNEHQKYQLVQFCSQELQEVFYMMPTSVRVQSQGAWETTLTTLFNELEESLKNDSGKAWRIRDIGSFNFKSHDDAKPHDKDYLTITFAHPALKPGVLDPRNKMESSTPQPTLAGLSVKIRKVDVLGVG